MWNLRSISVPDGRIEVAADDACENVSSKLKMILSEVLSSLEGAGCLRKIIFRR